MSWIRKKTRTGGGVISRSNPRVLQLGAVVWAAITPDGGGPKDRRSIIIELPPAGTEGKVLVIGVTSDRGRYDPSNTSKYPRNLYHPIPYCPNGTHPSQYRQPSAAKLTFIQEFSRNQLESSGGMISQEELDRLMAWIDNPDCE